MAELWDQGLGKMTALGTVDALDAAGTINTREGSSRRAMVFQLQGHKDIAAQ